MSPFRKVKTNPGPPTTRPLAKNDNVYESRLAEELRACGLKVVHYSAYSKNPDDLERALSGNPDLVLQQFPVRTRDYEGKSHRWVLDFALPALKVAIEIDGFYSSGNHGIGGHRNWTGFHRDRTKDRGLQWQGWHVLRFGPADMSHKAAVRSAHEVADYLRTLKGEEVSGYGKPTN